MSIFAGSDRFTLYRALSSVSHYHVPYFSGVGATSPRTAYTFSAEIVSIVKGWLLQLCIRALF